MIDFPPFQLDLRAWQLHRDGEPVPLRPKTLAVLRFLAERPGELVTKAALLDAVWAGAAVSEDVVRISAGELRAALGDDRAAPRFIETVPRLGYRFVARMGARECAVPVPGATAAGDRLVVGRDAELARMAEWMHAAVHGRRQLVFVTGEAGIGKTTLVDAAIRGLARTVPELRVARGQCVEQYGGGAPYKPVLEALAALRRGPEGPTITATLRDRAPRWLLDVLEPPPARAAGAPDAAAGYEHTLHMLAASLDALAERPLVVVFEDVHWSDHSTLDLLSMLARGRGPASLVVLCTLRAADAIARAHPLMAVKRELLRKGECRELLLGGLPAADVARYLAARFPTARLPAALLPLLVERSDGNPFFVVTLVDHLLESGTLRAGADGWQLVGSPAALRKTIPEGLRAVIEPRLERLTPAERRVLEAGAVGGVEFTAHAVAAVAPAGSDLADVEVVEQICAGLARRHDVVRALDETSWPDGTTSARYGFRHALYQQVLHQRLAPSVRRRLHQSIGERLEAGYAGRTGDVANELAAHFERSGDVERAVRYHGEAAAHARARSSHQETRLHVESALQLLRRQQETTAGMQRRMPLLHDLAWASFASRGWGDEEAMRVFTQMRELAERLDRAAARFKAMEGELIVHTMRAEYAVARQRGEELLLLAEQTGNRTAIAGALPPIGAVLMHVGEVEAAQAVAERGRTLGDLEQPTIQSVSCGNLLASTLVHQGRVAEARAMNREAVALAERSDMPYLRAHAATYAATIHQLTCDVPRTRALAADAIGIATELGFDVLGALATLYRAWCDVQDDRGGAGLAELRAAFDAYVASGQRISTSSYGLLVVEGHLVAGDVLGANAMLDRTAAFVAETGERLVEHEIHRLRGECMLAGAVGRGQRRDAATCFERAITIAAQRKALLFELRAAIALYRVQPKRIRDRLAGLVERFGPADDYADLRTATALLGGG